LIVNTGPLAQQLHYINSHIYIYIRIRKILVSADLPSWFRYVTSVPPLNHTIVVPQDAVAVEFDRFSYRNEEEIVVRVDTKSSIATRVR